MAVYIIKRKNRNKKIVTISKKTCGYEFKPNIRNKDLIQITQLYLLDEDLINKILIKKQDSAFRRLTAIVMSVLEDDDTTTGDAIIALDEVAKQKSIIIKKYKQYLKKEDEEKMLKRLKLLEKNLKEKLIILQQMERNIEEKSYSR